MQNPQNQSTPLPPPAGRGGKPPTLLRSIGQFFGHVIAGAVTPVEAGKETSAPGAGEAEGRAGQIVRQEVQERTARVEGAQLKLRRTIIDEVEVLPDDAGAPPAKSE